MTACPEPFRSAGFALPAVLLWAALAAMPRTCSAQNVNDGFDPNANGAVRALVVAPDGKILVSGAFTTIAAVTHNRIARLNPDGSLDETFAADVDDTVDAIALQADGRVVIGGGFTTIDGSTRISLARLRSTLGCSDFALCQTQSGLRFPWKPAYDRSKASAARVWRSRYFQSAFAEPQTFLRRPANAVRRAGDFLAVSLLAHVERSRRFSRSRESPIESQRMDLRIEADQSFANGCGADSVARSL